MRSRSKNSSPAAAVENRIFVALLKAADLVGQDAERFLKSEGLSGAQYNVLRILRGSEPQGLPCRGIGDAMISRDPDITRLLDRMEKQDLITRERQTDDRRVVKARITPKGLEILKALDAPVRERHKRQFEHLTSTQLNSLLELLEAVAVRQRAVEEA
jgi:DNA-binding MarR family transcriptional regulator